MDQGKQVFKKRGRRICTGKFKQVTTASAIREEASKGKHVTRARGWWKRGDVAACATHANMACWVHQDSILDDDEVIQGLREAWDQESSRMNWKYGCKVRNVTTGYARKLGVEVVTTSQERHGRGTDQPTKEGWVRVAFVSSNKEDILRSRWVEKKKESAQYGQN